MLLLPSSKKMNRVWYNFLWGEAILKEQHQQTKKKEEGNCTLPTSRPGLKKKTLFVTNETIYLCLVSWILLPKKNQQLNFGTWQSSQTDLLYFSDLQNDMALAIGHANRSYHHTVSLIYPIYPLYAHICPGHFFSSDFVMHVRMKVLTRRDIDIVSSTTKVCKR